MTNLLNIYKKIDLNFMATICEISLLLRLLPPPAPPPPLRLSPPPPETRTTKSMIKLSTLIIRGRVYFRVRIS